MCGRFAASASTEELIETFAIDEVLDEPLPTFNAAPTDLVPAVVERLDKATDAVVRTLVTPRWGLVPSWAKDPGIGARMINARAETVATKPAFRAALARRRCLVPADGFYEWTPALGPGGKQVKEPWFIRRADGEPLAMAGLYEFWKDPAAADGPWLTTCTIITTQVTDAVGHVHDRMPMTVRRDDWGAWLDPRRTEAPGVLPLLWAPQGHEVEAFRVAPLVNHVRNDGPDLVRPLV